jgi:amphi-Trp domain-containing protein
MKKKNDREKRYRNPDVGRKLRRLADALESGATFVVQIDGQRVRVPGDASVELEYESRGANHEIEIEISWKSR